MQPTIPLAYLDPAFFSMAIQVLAGTVLAALFTVKLWWSRLTEKLGNLFGWKSEAE
jgi:hypothetical protein